MHAMLTETSTESMPTASSSISDEPRDSSVTSIDAAVTQQMALVEEPQPFAAIHGSQQSIMTVVPVFYKSTAVVSEQRPTASSLLQSSRGKVSRTRGCSNKRSVRGTRGGQKTVRTTQRVILPAAAADHSNGVNTSLSHVNAKEMLRAKILSGRGCQQPQHGMSSVECRVAVCRVAS